MLVWGTAALCPAGQGRARPCLADAHEPETSHNQNQRSFSPRTAGGGCPHIGASKKLPVAYRPLWCCSFGARGGGLDLWEVCLGALCFGGGAEWVVFDACDGRVSLARLVFPPAVPPVADPFLTDPFLGDPFFGDQFFADPFLDGGVNGRNPSFEFPLVAGVDGPRASFGDMAGA